MTFLLRYRNTKVKMNPTKSLTRWMASDIIAIEPAIVPPITSPAMKTIEIRMTVTSRQ